LEQGYHIFAVFIRLSRISIPSISFPRQYQPGLSSLAKSSARGISPTSRTILFLTSSGFLLCASIGVSTTVCTPFEMRFGCPFVAMMQISGFALVQNPKPQNHLSVCFLHRLTQQKPSVLYSKPQRFIVSRPSSKQGNVTQRNKIQSSSAISATGSEYISSLLIVR